MVDERGRAAREVSVEERWRESLDEVGCPRGISTTTTGRRLFPFSSRFRDGDRDTDWFRESLVEEEEDVEGDEGPVVCCTAIEW